jgi:catechol 2,3-dioxygenase-like lactoylglutathione lyase family enzyme
VTGEPESKAVGEGDDWDVDDGLDLRFVGPLVSVGNVEDHLPLFANVLGLEPRAIQELDPAQVQALWGVAGHGAGSVLLETGESRVGVRLLQFAASDPSSAIRERGRAAEPNAARELRFLTRDFEVARHVIERAGFDLRSVSRYSAPTLGRFTEARFQGPDGISVSVMRLHDRGMEPWVRITDRLFGELLAVEIAVPDVDAAAAFYDLLGLQRVDLRLAWAARAGPDDEHVTAEEVAESAPSEVAPPTSEAHEVSFGSEPRAPILTLTSGTTEPVAATMIEETLVGRRGVVALRFHSPSIEPIRRRIWSAAGQRCGARVLSLGRGILEPMGAVESMVVRGPGGILHHFLGRL